ncbi:uncharacterized protein DUF262 [Flavobacterium chryseum]|uniref:DUF262 domain-containing protein n=1 Tax=Flavobacterium sp. P3160 TaxID=2512113 RepID=UPI00105D20AA|nr:DUF262 domain-containing protein [Flavobacterium sp. P3160]TDO72834.1 uncharacterized protein DUF262 [Flavobacterium sp. P3160]
MADEFDENDDIEIEEGNEDIKIEIPFDPSEINIKIIPRNIGQLVELLEDNQILIPKYQRLPNLWSEVKKSRFIESLMLDLPIPLFYFDEGDDKKWYVVDGLQRMSTLEHFIIGKGDVGKNKNKLVLQNLEFLTDYNGKTWEELPKDIKRRINSNQVTINLIGKGTPDEVKYTIFSRINQGDVPLKAQEIRTALFQGYRVDFLESLISEETDTGKIFRKVTDGSVKSKRQEDLDFISRFISFYLIDYNKYEPDMDRFITTGTKLIPVEIEKHKKIKSDFSKSMILSYDIFGRDAFRKRINENDSRKPINKPIFEVLSVSFSKLDEYNAKYLLNNKETFISKFIAFQRDNTKFWNAITTGTATKDSVINRNREFSNFLNTFLNDF